jgi:hypothetical protein
MAVSVNSAAGQRFAWAYAIGLIITILAVSVAGIPALSGVGMALLPGISIAAIAFPLRIHSTYGLTYLFMAGFLNAFVLAWPVMWLLAWVSRVHDRH